MRRRVYFLYAFFGVFVADCFAIHFERLGINQGLPHSVVVSTLQDKAGFLWFITSGGIVRYDGIDWREYPVYVRSACMDDDGDIWYTDVADNSYLFSSVYGKTIQIPVVNQELASIKQIEKNQVLILTRSGILYTINKSKWKLDTVFIPKQPLGFATKGIVIDKKGNIWIGAAQQGLYCINPKTKDYINILPPPSIRTKNQTSIAIIFPDNVDNFWVGTNDALFLFSTENSTHTHIDKVTKIMNPNIGFSCAIQSYDGRMWFGTKQGLLSYSKKLDKAELFVYNPDDEKSISGNNITDLFIDNTNILWIGTNKAGLSKLDLNAKKFYVFQRTTNEKLLPTNLISGLAVDHNPDFLWVYSSTPALSYINIKTKATQHFFHRPNSKIGFEFNSEFGIIKRGEYPTIWVAPWLWTLHKVHSQNGKAQVIKYTTLGKLNPHFPSGWSYRDLIISKRGGVYIAFSDEGIEYFDTKTKKFQNITSQFGFQNEVKKQYVWSLFEDDSLNVWAGHSDSGFWIYNPKKNTLETYKLPLKDAMAQVYVIKQVGCGQVYMGTSQGIFIYDFNTRRCIDHIDEKQGMPSKYVRTILEDSHQNLWIGTDKGLVRYNMPSKNLIVFTSDDGLPSDEFSINSADMNTKGEMFFGTSQGVLYFHPDSISISGHLPKAVITSLRMMQRNVLPGDTINGRVVLSKDIAYTDKIELTYVDNAFTLNFASTHHSNPKRNLYKYKLEGWDKDWIETPASKRTATYTNLPSGKYIFKVMTGSSENIWNTEPAQLVIEVKPPFWEALWFRLTVLFVSIVSLVAYYKARTKQLSLQKSILKRQVESQTLKLKKINDALIEQHDAVKNQYETVKHLAEIGQHITSSIEVKEIIKRVYKSLNQIMDAKRFSIGIIDRKQGWVHFEGYEDGPERWLESTLPLDVTDRLSIWCIQHAEPLLIIDAEKQVGEYLGNKIDQYLQPEAPKSMMYVPLSNINKEVIGVVLIKSILPFAYSNFHFNIAKNLATYISIALDNAYAYQKIATQSEKLKEANAVQKRFLTNITHEFKTPLTLIQGPIDTLLAKSTKENEKHMLSLIQRNSLRLQKLIQQLIDLAKHDEQTMAPKATDFDLVSYTRDIVKSFQYLSQTQQITLDVHLPEYIVWVHLDKSYIEEILYNILSNAIKYTAAKDTEKHPGWKGHVTFQFCLETDILGNECIVFRVKDNGVGIPESHIDKIFERFYRSSWVQNQTEGLGIGLALTKKIVESCGGEIMVKSQLDDFTEFVIKLPYVRQLHQEKQTSQAQVQIQGRAKVHHSEKITRARHDSSVKILIVEDNPEIADFIESLFSDTYQIYKAFDGMAGLEMARVHMPEVIISDVMLPDLDGYQMCSILKQQKETNHIPIILLTARTDQEDMLLGLGSGANIYLTKPFNPEILFQAVANLLHLKTALQQSYQAFTTQNKNNTLSNPEETTFVQKILQFLEEKHSESSLQVEDLATHIGMGRTLFYKKFVSVIGMQPADYIRKFRLEKAKMAFDQGNDDVAQVAYSVGFEYPNYFSKCFKETFGCSPSEYLKSLVS